MSSMFIAVLIFFSLICFIDIVETKRRTQLAYINNYEFRPGLKAKLISKHPLLSQADIDLVFSGLRDYFYFCYDRQGKVVSMPSQVVDDAWHEFILFSKDYRAFCRQAYGRFLHHTPAEAMPTPTLAQDGIKRAWQLACSKEHIDPKEPDKLPLLFAIDSQLNIAGGFIYSLNCKALTCGDHEFCASDIGCGSGSDGGCGGCSGCGGCGGCGG